MTPPDLSPYNIIALANLHPSPTNPRKTFDEHALNELAKTIHDYGVIQPIVVRIWPDEYGTPDGLDNPPLYEIVSGERRYRASKIVARPNIPAIVKVLTHKQVAEIQIIENLQRSEVNELEEAEGYAQLMKDHGYSADEIAEKIRKSRRYIYGRIKLTALCTAAKKAFNAGDIHASVAGLIARIPTPELQTEALTAITKDHLSFQQATALIKEQYMLNLKKAPFSRKVIDLIPDAGSCDDCSKCTGNNPELFADIDSAHMCTDPACFSLKKAAHHENQCRKLEEAGKEVYRGKEAEKLAPYGAHYEIRDHARLDAENYHAGYNSQKNRSMTNREVLQQAGIEVDTAFIEDPRTHELIEIVQNGHLKAAMFVAQPKREPSDYEKQQKEREKKARAEAVYRRKLLQQIHDKHSAAFSENGNRTTLDETEIRMIAESFLHHCAWDVQRHLVKYYLPEGIDQYQQRGALAEKLKTLTLPEVLIFMLDLALSGDSIVSSWEKDIATPARLTDAATRAGLDPKAIRASLEKPAKTAKKPPPAAEKTASSITKAARASDVNAAKKPADAKKAAQTRGKITTKPATAAKAKAKSKAPPKKDKEQRPANAGRNLDKTPDAPARCDKTIELSGLDPLPVEA